MFEVWRALSRLVFAAIVAAGSLPAHALDAAEAEALALEAYVFGYPLVTMEMTRRVMTNVAEPEAQRAPMGHLVRVRRYPDASFRDVTAPNADTLYTTAWLDVATEPWILSLPDAGDRYYLMPLLDGWTEVFQVPGKRTTGTKAQRYAIVGPGWQGTLPEGVVRYDAPTSLVWILGRIYCTGTPEDYAAVHALQDAITLVPLSAHGKPWVPPPGRIDPAVDMKTPVRDQVNALGVEEYFSLLAALMQDNPPAAADAPMVAKLARLGIVAGRPFSLAALGPEVARALGGVPKAGFERIMASFQATGTRQNGWTFTTRTGTYGTEYLRRALITAIGLGANRPQDAVYPTSEADPQGQPYSGAQRYVMRFEKGALPPAEAFWSLTMYDGDYFFVANPLDRHTLSSRDALRANPDGSVDLYLQHESPGEDEESNWLPAPPGRFVAMLRLYWPREAPPSILDGSWKIPAIERQP